MNTTNILLATTSLLIVVAFVLSLGTLKKDSSTDEARKQREELAIELAKLQAETDALRQTPIYQPNYTPTQAPSLTPAPSAATSDLSDEQTRQIEELQKQLAEEREDKNKAVENAEKAQEETLHFMGEQTREFQREERKKNRIRMALKMGTVGTVNTEYGYITFTPESGMTFQTGQELGIRRQSGVLGRVVVSRQQGDQYAADMKPNAYAGGLPPITIGDELIMLPDEYNVPVE